MRKTQRIVAWFIGAGIVGILMLVALQYIDADPIIERAQTEISKQIGGEVVLGQVVARLLPMPHIIIRDSRFTVGDVAEGTVASLSVFPEIWPIFQAEFKPSKVLLTSPAVQIELPEAIQAPESAVPPPGPGGLQAKLSDIIAQLQSAAPNLRLRVEDGNLRLSRQGREEFVFDDVDLRIHVRALRAEMACASNMWQRLSVRWTFDPELFPGNGRVSLFQFEPHRLSPWLPADLPVQLGESLVNLDIQLQRSHKNRLKANIQGSLPKLTLISRKQDLVILGNRFEANVILGEAEQRLTLDRLSLESPRLEADGELIISRESPKKAFRVHGTEVDGPAVRRTVLFLAGTIPVVREIFDYVQGGYVPEITLSSSGDSWEELSIVERIRIQGTIQQGRIRIPAVDLNLENVEGEALIADGFLNGTRLKGTVGNTSGNKGRLRVGFRGKNAPFHLEIDVDTDLAELPGHLKGLIPSEDFQKWLKRLTKSSGTAKGRLTLGDALDNITPVFRVDTLALNAELDFMPYPVVIDGGSARFDGRRLFVEDLSGRVRKSTFAKLKADVTWGTETALRISTGVADLHMPELHSWFSSVEGTAERLAAIDVTSGRLELADISVKGPLLKADRWDYLLTGTVKELEIRTPLSQDLLYVSHMNYSVSPDNFTFRDSRLELRDAVLEMDGALQGQLPTVDRLQATFNGDLGARSYELLGKLAVVPPAIAFQAPIQLDGVQVRWERVGSLALKGKLNLAGDLRIVADMEKLPDEVNIRELTIKDDLSNAKIRVHVNNDGVKVGFAGNLDKVSVAKVLNQQHVNAGTISGDFSAHFNLNDPKQSSTKGILSGETLVLPFGAKESVQIDKFMVLGIGNALTIQTIDALWSGSRFKLNGRVDAVPGWYTAKLKLKADSINWDRIKKTLSKERVDPSGNDRESDVGRWPIKMVMDVESNRFVYESFEWESVKAMINIANRRVEIEVTEANLCGISTPGLLVIDKNANIKADFSAASRTSDLEKSVSCLFKDADRFDGTYRYKGAVSGRGPEDEFLESLEGSMEFHAQEGRLYGRGTFGVLKKILALVNVTEVFAGAAPDFSAKGFGYHRIQAIADIEGSNLIIKAAIVDGHNMKITSQGRVSLGDQELDLTVIVAPLKTVDRAVEMLPVVGKILDGSLLTIPLKVTGPLSDPVVNTLAPGSVGQGLIGITERTLKLPFQMFEP